MSSGHVRAVFGRARAVPALLASGAVAVAAWVSPLDSILVLVGVATWTLACAALTVAVVSSDLGEGARLGIGFGAPAAALAVASYLGVTELGVTATPRPVALPGSVLVGIVESGLITLGATGVVVGAAVGVWLGHRAVRER